MAEKVNGHAIVELISIAGVPSRGCGMRYRNAGLPGEDLAQLDELAVEGGVEGPAERELDGPGRCLSWGLSLAHIFKPGAGSVGVDQARTKGHDQLVLAKVRHAPLAGDLTPQDAPAS